MILSILICLDIEDTVTTTIRFIVMVLIAHGIPGDDHITEGMDHITEVMDRIMEDMDRIIVHGTMIPMAELAIGAAVLHIEIMIITGMDTDLHGLQMVDGVAVVVESQVKIREQAQEVV